MPLFPRLPLGLAFFLTACPDAGSDGEAGDGDGDCDVVARTVVEDLGAPTIALAVAGDTIAYVSRVDLAAPTVLSVIDSDGSGAATLYTSPPTASVSSIAWAGDEIVFLESPNATEPSRVFRIAASGGDPVAVGMGTFGDTERLLGVEDGAAFVLTGGPARVDRVDLDSGAVERVGQVPGSTTPLHAVFSAGEVLFVVDVPADVYRLRTSDRDVDAQPVGVIGGDPACAFPLGGLTATPTRIACGLVDVAAFARADGAGPDLIVDGDLAEGPAANIVFGASGERVYVLGTSDGIVETSLRKVDSAGGDVEPIACDVRKVSWQTADASFPNQTEYQIGIGSSDVVWVEERREDTGDEMTFTLRAAAK